MALALNKNVTIMEIYLRSILTSTCEHLFKYIAYLMDTDFMFLLQIVLRYVHNQV